MLSNKNIKIISEEQKNITYRIIFSKSFNHCIKGDFQFEHTWYYPGAVLGYVRYYDTS